MHRLYGEIQIRKTGIKKEFSDYNFEKDCYILFVKAWRVHGLAFGLCTWFSYAFIQAKDKEY